MNKQLNRIQVFIFLYISVNILFSSSSIIAQTYTAQWTETYGNDSSTANLKPVEMIVDHSGSIYTLTIKDHLPYRRIFSIIKMSPQGSVIWNRTYVGPNNTDMVALELACDLFNNIYIAATGNTDSTGYSVIKYDSAGNLLWHVNKTALGNIGDLASSFEVSDSGSVYITGKAYTAPNHSDLYTFKLNSDGTLAWERYYNYPNLISTSDRGELMKIDSHENIFISGYMNAIRSLCKYDSSGNLQWTTNYAINFPIKKLALDDSSNVFLIGSLGSNNRVIKYDNSGNLKFDKTYPTPYSTIINDATIFDHALYTIGSIQLSSIQKTKVLTMKLDLNGDTIWTRNYIEPQNKFSAGNKILVDNNQNIIAFATIYDLIVLSNLLVLKYDSAGNLLWSNIPGNPVPTTQFLFGTSVLDSLNEIYLSKIVDDSTTYMETLKLDSSGNQQWTQSEINYKNGTDEATKIILDHQGNIITGGNSNATYKKNDLAILKYNMNGSIIWKHRTTLPSTITMNLAQLICDSLDNILLCGTSTNLFTQSLFVTKLDSSGNEIWRTQNLGYVSSMTTDNQNNIYILAFEPHISFTTAKLLKYNSTGTLMWNKTISDSADIHFEIANGNALKFDGSSNIYAFADDESQPNINPQFLVLKLDTAGNVIWKRIYHDPTSSGDVGVGLILDNLLNPILMGYSYDNTTKYLIVKYDSSGNFLWEARSLTNVGFSDFPKSFVVDTDNNIYVTGYHQDQNNYAHCLTIKFDRNGTIKWSDIFSSTSSGMSVDHGNGITLDQNGRIIVVGYSSDTTSKTMVVVYDSLGNRLYTDFNNQSSGNNLSQANDVIADQNASFYLTGSISSIANSSDFITMKYTDFLTSITIPTNNQQNLIPFPNPFKEKYFIKYYSDKNISATLETYDLIGELISSRTISLIKGENLIAVNANELSSGSYNQVLKLADGKRFSCKIMALN